MNPEYYHAPPTPGNVEAAKAATEAGLIHGIECSVAMGKMNGMPIISRPWWLSVELDNGELCGFGNEPVVILSDEDCEFP